MRLLPSTAQMSPTLTALLSTMGALPGTAVAFHLTPLKCEAYACVPVDRGLAPKAQTFDLLNASVSAMNTWLAAVGFTSRPELHVVPSKWAQALAAPNTQTFLGDDALTALTIPSALSKFRADAGSVTLLHALPFH